MKEASPRYAVTSLQIYYRRGVREMQADFLSRGIRALCMEN